MVKSPTFNARVSTPSDRVGSNAPSSLSKSLINVVRAPFDQYKYRQQMKGLASEALDESSTNELRRKGEIARYQMARRNSLRDADLRSIADAPNLSEAQLRIASSKTFGADYRKALDGAYTPEALLLNQDIEVFQRQLQSYLQQPSPGRLNVLQGSLQSMNTRFSADGPAGINFGGIAEKTFKNAVNYQGSDLARLSQVGKDLDAVREGAMSQEFKIGNPTQRFVKANDIKVLARGGSNIEAVKFGL